MIHAENPFADEPDARDPVRRFRGRLSAPVTIFTAGDESGSTGLTVSSLNVVEGDPGLVEAVIGPATELWEAIESSGRFVIHVCTDDDRAVAEVFAGLRPSPGGLFAGLEVTQTRWGPAIERLANRAYCSFVSARETGYGGVVSASIDSVEIADLANPLVYFRGRYRHLG